MLEDTTVDQICTGALKEEVEISAQNSSVKGNSKGDDKKGQVQMET